MSHAALNRALLARQGLLERLELDAVAGVEAVGAVQAQDWGTPPAALWSRLAGFTVDALHEALERGALVSGISLRGTLHLVSAREHPEYAALMDPGWWRRTKSCEPGDADGLRDALADAARESPRSPKELAEVAEAWIAEHPGALPADEIEGQRTVSWRPLLRWGGFVRVPAKGAFGATTPAASRAAPRPPTADVAAALDAVVLRHLRAFGPSAAEDVAGWTDQPVPAVRAAIGRRSEDLVELRDEDGRTLHDLRDAPRPDPETPAPVRLLAAFDSILLAYAPRRRARIMSERHREAVYVPGNLRMLPAFTVDGLVAGVWSIAVEKRVATLTLTPVGRLRKGARAELIAEAEAMVRAVRLAAKDHRVVVA